MGLGWWWRREYTHSRSQNLPTASKFDLIPNSLSLSLLNSMSYSTIKHCGALQASAVFSSRHYTQPHLVNIKGTECNANKRGKKDLWLRHPSWCPATSFASMFKTKTHHSRHILAPLCYRPHIFPVNALIFDLVMNISPKSHKTHSLNNQYRLVCSCSPHRLVSQGMFSNIPVQYISIFLAPSKAPHRLVPAVRAPDSNELFSYPFIDVCACVRACVREHVCEFLSGRREAQMKEVWQHWHDPPTYIC